MEIINGELYDVHDEDIVNGTFEIPESVIGIGYEAFSSCSSLTSIKIPNSIIIGNFAFLGCSNLTLITISDLVTKIGTYAFADCPNLENIYLPDCIQLSGRWFGEFTNPKCKVHYQGHVFTVEDIREYY